MADDKRVRKGPACRRIGKFEISDLLLDDADNKRLIERILARCDVLAQDRSPFERKVVYYAECEDFDEVPDGEEAPLYMWSFNSDTDALSCEKVKEEEL